MPTRIYEFEAEVEDLAESGEIGCGVLVRDSTGISWLAFDTEDGPEAIRPLNEDDELPEYCTPGTPVPSSRRSGLADLPLPLYVTTEEK